MAFTGRGRTWPSSCLEKILMPNGWGTFYQSITAARPFSTRTASCDLHLKQAHSVPERPAWPSPLRSASAKAPSHDLELLLRLRKSSIPVVAVLLTGRPMWITPELDASNAFVVAWLPGTEGGGIADVLFRNAGGEVNYDFTGKLSFSWPHSSRQTGD